MRVLSLCTDINSALSVFNNLMGWLVFDIKQKKMKKMIYSVPIVEYYSIEVEHGFAGSVEQLPEYKEDDDIIVIG